MADLVEASRFLSVGEADIARTFLDSEGIASVVFDREFGIVAGGGPMAARGIRLMVSEDHLAEAKYLLSRSESPPSEPILPSKGRAAASRIVFWYLAIGIILGILIRLYQ